MAQPRHRRQRAATQSHRSHLRVRSARRVAPLAVPALAVLATSALVPVVSGSAAPAPTGGDSVQRLVADRAVQLSAATGRTNLVSRSAATRAALTQDKGSHRMGDAEEATSAQAMRAEVNRTRVLDETVLSPGKVADVRWAGAPLNLWARPTEDSRLLDVLPYASRLPVTGDHTKQWVELNWHGTSRWVNRDYVLLEKPRPEPEETSSSSTGSTGSSSGSSYSGTTTAPCPDGSSVESGLTSNAVTLYRSVCAAFPELTTYGGYRADSEDHSAGTSIDFMISDSGTGDAVAQYVIDHAAELDVNYVMWSQQIWSVERASEGWRYVEDRGSATANHYDHVHVTTY